MERGFAYNEARLMPEDQADKILDAWNELKNPKAPGGKLVKSKKKK